jgi:FMN-dependent NADH-azoreductase
MSTLLKIDVSTRGSVSISRVLSSQFLEQWRRVHINGHVIERDIATTELPFLEFPWIAANFSKPSARSDEQRVLLQFSDDLVEELQAADQFLIATPMYNFGIPAKLKAYIDGSYTGLLSGKKATVIIASAGEYTTGAPSEGLDTLKPYLREILGFIGVTDVTFLQSGSTWKVDSGLEKADAHVAPLRDQLMAAASA